MLGVADSLGRQLMGVACQEEASQAAASGARPSLPPAHCHQPRAGQRASLSPGEGRAAHPAIQAELPLAGSSPHSAHSPKGLLPCSNPLPNSANLSTKKSRLQGEKGRLGGQRSGPSPSSTQESPPGVSLNFPTPLSGL